MNDSLSVNLTNLREITDGDTELEAELFEEFRTSSSALMIELEHNLQNDDYEPWRKTAHALKGIAANLGAGQLANLAKEGQENYKALVNVKQNLLNQIKSEYINVLRFLELQK